MDIKGLIKISLISLFAWLFLLVGIRWLKAPAIASAVIEIQWQLIPYSLDQTPLSISCRSRIVTAPQAALNEIVAALEY